MAYQPLERLLPRANNSIYKLVILAARRATELADGLPRLVEEPSSGKTTTIALDEILQGKVYLRGSNGETDKKSKEKKKG